LNPELEYILAFNNNLVLHQLSFFMQHPKIKTMSMLK
jgi:hypothetical protein